MKTEYWCFFSFFPMIFFIDFWDRGRQRGIYIYIYLHVREKLISCLRMHPAGDHTCTLGMCSDQESNQQAFGVRDDTPTNGASWSEQCFFDQKGKRVVHCYFGIRSYFQTFPMKTCRIPFSAVNNLGIILCECNTKSLFQIHPSPLR